jgi:PLD-like domain
LANLQALKRAADRVVKVRIYLDGTQFAEREPTKVFEELAHTPGVEIRVKRSRGAPMHLKSYEIDSRILRTGAANFSASGLKRQDNERCILQRYHQPRRDAQIHGPIAILQPSSKTASCYSRHPGGRYTFHYHYGHRL